MDFGYHYTTEQQEFRKEVRGWLALNIPGDMKAPVDRRDLSNELYQFWRGMHLKMAVKGWLYPTYPKEYGGGGLTGAHETILLEEFELARVIHGFTNNFVFPTLLVWATEEQKRKFMVPLLAAEKIALQGFTEPNAGSDLASLQSRAVRDGGDWIISGQKIFVSGHGYPDYLFGPIMTDPDAPRHKNLGYFLIPCPSQGLELSRLNLLSSEDSYLVFMDKVRVPGDHLIGGDHEGWKVTQTTLEIEHGGRGVAFPRDEALDNLLEYVKEIKETGSEPGRHAIIQQLAMDSYIDSHIETLLAQRNHWMNQVRQEMSYHGSQSDMFRKVYRVKNAERARDVMGPYSLLGVREPHALFGGQPEFFQRDSLANSHSGGTPEIQKVIMARRIGISRTSERAAITPATHGVQD